MAAPARVARSVGRYDILDELGRGGMATVYLARQTDLDRLVALKELDALRQADAQYTRRFLRESRLAGSLSHPNVVTVHDYFESDGVPYIAMEYVPGGSLRPHIGQLLLPQIAGVLEGILAALDHAHGRHVVHRDLKPENVMVTADGRVKIADFGIAKATGAAQTRTGLTRAGTTVGTPQYMAPEQAMGREVGPWTDLYAAGVMAFEMFVGRAPFHDTDEPMAVLMRQVSDPIPRATAVDARIEPEISDWIERLVAKEPGDRVHSAAEAWDELEETVIAIAGARWRRASRVPATAPATGGHSRTASSSTARVSSSSTARMSSSYDTPSEAPTHRLRDEEARAHAPTVAPRAPAPVPVADEVDAPVRRASAGGRRRLVKTALALFAVAVAAAAALAPHGSRPGAASAPSATPPASTSGARPATRAVRPASGTAGAVAVTGRDLALRVPRGWARLRRRPPLRGFPLSDGIAVAPAGAAGGPVVEFGLVRGAAAANVALLPAAVVRAAGAPPGGTPPRTAVRFPGHGLQAWRYDSLAPAGPDRTMTAYVVPTTAGVATVACTAPSGGVRAFADTCATAAGSLRLREARAYPVGPSAAYANTLNTTLGGVSRAATAGEPDLAAARSPAGRASAARVLALAYDAAATQLAGIDVSPADRAINRGLVTALHGVDRAYRTAAGAATGGSADRYLAASGAIAEAKARVNLALAAVHAAGYAASSASARPSAPSASRRPAPTGSSRAPKSAPKRDVGDSRSDDPSDDSADP